jgi:hypothetical protein
VAINPLQYVDPVLQSKRLGKWTPSTLLIDMRCGNRLGKTSLVESIQFSRSIASSFDRLVSVCRSDVARSFPIGIS